MKEGTGSEVLVLLAFSIAWVALAAASTNKLTFHIPPTGKHPTSEMVATLQDEISLNPGDPFRGSVATILAEPGGSLRPLLGFSEGQVLPAFAFLQFNTALGELGGEHDLHRLWWLNIPTISEYGQGVSRPLMTYMTEFLSAPGTPTEINYALPKSTNVDVLRALGVRFLIVDRHIPHPLAVLRKALRLKNGGTLSLYELTRANLATFTPTSLVVENSARSIIDRIREDPAALEWRAFVGSRRFREPCSGAWRTDDIRAGRSAYRWDQRTRVQLF